VADTRLPAGGSIALATVAAMSINFSKPCACIVGLVAGSNVRLSLSDN
jgi:hypothetical protein